MYPKKSVTRMMEVTLEEQGKDSNPIVHKVKERKA